MTRAGVAAALRFFEVYMPTLPLEKQFSFLQGIDLHSPMREVTLTPPAVLAAFRYPTQNAFGLFYTLAGTSPYSLGINPGGRMFRRFRVTVSVRALESRCSSARETWTDVDPRMAFAGGGLQYIVPRAEDVLAG